MTVIDECNIKALSERLKRPVEEIEQMPYVKIKEMLNQMEQETKEKAIEDRKASKEYIHIVEKFFRPLPFLTQWWTKEAVIAACAKHADIRSLCKEKAVKKGTVYRHPNAEYVRTEGAYLEQYTKKGELLMERAYEMCDIYRIENEYHTVSGPVIHALLHEAYPELIPFGIECFAYEDHEEGHYEVYAKNHIYTPFQALMEGDINTIKNRNIEYAKAYNCGIYTPAIVKERLESDEAEAYFEVIRNMKRGVPL